MKKVFYALVSVMVISPVGFAEEMKFRDTTSVQSETQQNPTSANQTESNNSTSRFFIEENPVGRIHAYDHLRN